MDDKSTREAWARERIRIINEDLEETASALGLPREAKFDVLAAMNLAQLARDWETLTPERRHEAMQSLTPDEQEILSETVKLPPEWLEEGRLAWNNAIARLKMIHAEEE